MIRRRQTKWSDYRFQFFDRNPQIFTAFEASLDELQAMVFEFSERKKYDLTRHALSELRNLLSAYLLARDKSLRIPTSTMAMFFPAQTTFDGVLTRQLERLKAHAAKGISSSDQEFVKQVVSVLGALSLTATRTHSYFSEYDESSVAAFVSAYLSGSIQDSAIHGLDDVALEGTDHLRDLCKELINKKLFTSTLTPIADLEKVASLAILRQSDVVLSVAVRARSDCLLHNCARGRAGTHIAGHLLQSLFRISRSRLASPLALEQTKVQYSVGPFLSPTERSSFAAVNVALAQAISDLTRLDQRDELQRLRSLYEELHDRAWLDFAELGMEAVKKNSFLLHFINTTIEQTIQTNFWLLNALDIPRIEISGWEAAQEQDLRTRFRDKIRNKIGWETTGIYSRIIPKMFEENKLGYLDDTIELQSLFAFWGLRFRIEDVAAEATERIFNACALLMGDKYRGTLLSARLAIHIARIGAYAIASGRDGIAELATERYSHLRNDFLARYPDERFAGDYQSAERELLQERRERGPMLIDAHDQEFFSKVTDEQIRAFFALLQ